MSREILVDGTVCEYVNTPAGIEVLVAARIAASKRLERRDIHIHQGGTVKTYCGRTIVHIHRVVGWEDAAEATCLGCSARFSPCCPGGPRGRCKIGCPVGIGR